MIYRGRVRYREGWQALIQVETPDGLHDGLFTLDEGDDPVERGDAVTVELSLGAQAVLARVRLA